jgi:hypothetical protein
MRIVIIVKMVHKKVVGQLKLNIHSRGNMEILPKELTDQLDNETRAELGLLPLEKDLDAAEEIKKSKEYKLGYASGYAAGRSYKSRLLQPNIKHPEDTCENCGNENVTWFTSSVFGMQCLDVLMEQIQCYVLFVLFNKLKKKDITRQLGK